MSQLCETMIPPVAYFGLSAGSSYVPASQARTPGVRCFFPVRELVLPHAACHAVSGAAGEAGLREHEHGTALPHQSIDVTFHRH